MGLAWQNYPVPSWVQPNQLSTDTAMGGSGASNVLVPSQAAVAVFVEDYVAASSGGGGGDALADLAAAGMTISSGHIQFSIPPHTSSGVNVVSDG